MTIAANIGDIGVLSFDAYFPDSIIGFKNKLLLDNNFAFYYLYVLKHSLNRIKITNTQDNLNLERLDTIFKALPHKSIQNKLASYLDIQASKIDQELFFLEEKIEKYRELKQTLIAHTILRGLDKNVELKDSEVEWIGDIPKHWGTDRLKNIFNERVGKNLDIKTGEAVTSNILSVMKDIGVINHRDKGNVGNKMSEDITNYKLVYPNDIVVNKMNVMIGSVGISKEFGALSVIYIILITKKDSYSKYYDYFFKMKAFQKSLRRIATGILEIREAVNMTLFMQEMMTKPPYDEQVAIANYLDEKTSKIDSIVEAIGKKIEVLKEFRKTLINDVVTGKVKVA
jgi:type I restriction enzyme S subunit